MPSRGVNPGFPFCCPGWHRYTPDRRRADEILFVAQASSSRDCHSARADVRLTGAAVFRAFLRHWSTRAPCLRRSSSVSGRPLSSRHWQRPDPPQHVAEQPTGQMPFCQQEPVVPGLLHQPASGFHQPLLETRERPALDPRRQDQPAPEGAQVVGPGHSVAGRTSFARNRWHDSRVQWVACLPSLIHGSAVPRLL